VGHIQLHLQGILYMCAAGAHYRLHRDCCLQGDVLEISAGTGRNLDHYRLADVSSLTLTDVSAPMLQQAEDKYFNQLQLHYK
jgi:ubiquinone/menaquinone biosynthesis C-methylase UbiE